MTGNWHDFWAMGGYARYVWSAYGIAGGVVLLNIVLPLWAHARLKRRIRNEEFVDD